jgi:hypothetical protein
MKLNFFFIKNVNHIIVGGKEQKIYYISENKVPYYYNILLLLYLQDLLHITQFNIIRKRN